MKKALFVCYGGGHAAALLPVVEQLYRSGSTAVAVLALTTARAVFENHGIPVFGYADLLEASDVRSRGYGRRLLSDISGSAVGVSEVESIAYLGQCMRDLVDEVGEAAAWEAYARSGRHAFAPRATMKRALNMFSPSIVVTTNSPKSERAALIAAAEAGIPSLMVPDMFCEPGWEAYHPLSATHFAVFTSLSRRNLEHLHGVPTENITVTGQPAFDKSHVPSQRECRLYTSRLTGRPQDRPYIVLATSPDIPDGNYEAHGSDDSVAGCKAVLRHLRNGKTNPLVLVKPHPSENDSAYRELCAGDDNAVVLPARSDLNQLLRGAAGMIAASPTTAVVDALALGVPCMVLSLRRKNLRDVLPWDDLGVPIIRSVEDVGKDALTSIITGEVSAIQRGVSEEFSQVCVGSGARIATLVFQYA